MKYIYGMLMICWIAFLQVTGQNMDLPGIASTLGALCLFIVKEKYIDKTYASIVYFIGAVVLAQFWGPFILLAAIPMQDFAYEKNYYLGAPALTIASYVCIAAGENYFILLLLLAAFVGFVLGAKRRNEQAYTGILDEERRLRYNLERAQNELIQSRREIEHLTEARERSRIAQELHDSIGHGIAGVLMQLEAAQRIHRRDADKTEEILKTCTNKLSETLTLTRNTVYNIMPGGKPGVEALEKVIAGFRFCPVAFEHSGDFGGVSATNMRILESNLTEALTNTMKHSRATQVSVRVDIRRRNVRFYYSDNGVGCGNIHDGMGLMGMRDRVKNAGGTISVDGGEGFLIVCNLPETDVQEEGGAVT
jgi:signal transduction histidine kinase